MNLAKRYILLCLVLACAPILAGVKKHKQQQFSRKEPLRQTLDAPFAYLMDADTQEVIYDQKGDERLEPASMTKILTAYIVMDYIKNGQLREDKLLTVSESAFQREGTTMFLNLGQNVRVIDLLKGLIIQSGNDAAVVLAEGIAGSEAEFADLMNRYASKLGMTNSHFVNASGLPTEGHYSTAHDLTVVAYRTFKDFPQYFPLWGQREFMFNNIKQINKNTLLGKNNGCDGMKTGRGNNNSFGMVATCARDGRRLFGVVNSLPSERERENQVNKLMEYGFLLSKQYVFFNAQHVLDHIPLWHGRKSSVKIGFTMPVKFVYKNIPLDHIQFDAQYAHSLRAPIEKGQVVGTMSLHIPGAEKPFTFDIKALESVERTNIFGRMYDGIVYLLGGRQYDKKHQNFTALTHITQTKQLTKDNHEIS